MPIEQNKVAVRKFFDAVNRQDLVLLAEVATPEVAITWPESIPWLYATTKGLHFEIIDLVAEGIQVSAQLAASGYHSGELFGIPPTGTRWTNRVLFFFNLLDGIIADVEALPDVENYIKQIGGIITRAAHVA